MENFDIPPHSSAESLGHKVTLMYAISIFISVVKQERDSVRISYE